MPTTLQMMACHWADCALWCFLWYDPGATTSHHTYHSREKALWEVIYLAFESGMPPLRLQRSQGQLAWWQPEDRMPPERSVNCWSPCELLVTAEHRVHPVEKPISGRRPAATLSTAGWRLTRTAHSCDAGWQHSGLMAEKQRCWKDPLLEYLFLRWLTRRRLQRESWHCRCCHQSTTPLATPWRTLPGP